mmetsp:Transcript_75668/g.138398  ORF Transcript_75668/g.138398 Transcript_75668/m.138398 type:complete len:241 (-) Transcript_75668:43-765(-)
MPLHAAGLPWAALMEPRSFMDELASSPSAGHAEVQVHPQPSSFVDTYVPEQVKTWAKGEPKRGSGMDMAEKKLLPPVEAGPLPISAAAVQWAQHAFKASHQAENASRQAYEALAVADAHVAAAKAAARHAQEAQVSAAQSAAAQVAQRLGFDEAPVGVPRPSAYKDSPIASPTPGLENSSPLIMSNMRPWALIAALAFPFLQYSHQATTQRRCGAEYAKGPSEFLVSVPPADLADEPLTA